MKPLGSGIEAVDKSAATIGTPLTLDVRCYNTELTKATTRAWLKVGDSCFVAADSVFVRDNRNLTLQFALNGSFPIKDKIVAATLVLDNKESGVMLLPSAVIINSNDSVKQGIIHLPQLSDLNVGTTQSSYPYREILEETIRNLFYHVPLWFAMLLIFCISMVLSFRHLQTQDLRYDIAATAFAKVGMLFGILGTVTGMLWAQYTWGKAWSWDIKQNTTAISLLMYAAYFVLRGSFDDDDRRARLSAVYNIFAFFMLIPLLFVIPRLSDSLHPGNGGNPAFSKMDLNSNMRIVFYPAVIAFMLLGIWIASLTNRIDALRARKLGLLEDNLVNDVV